MEALFLLGFVLALREAGRSWAELSLRFVPAALIAAGAVYAYSFPGLIWLGGAFVFWLLAEAVLGRRQPPWRPLLLAALPFAILVAPEVGRMIDFQQFETFDPNGPGLGNLFGQVSPFEALGIWPSGDFRLAPGDGAVPAIGYYLGAAFGLVLLVHGIWRCGRGREVAILSGLAAAAVAYAAGRVGGTAYASAKAIEVAAPICALVILLPLLRELDRRLLALAATAFIAAAGVCSLLAFANAPVGPSTYTSQLNDLRKQVGEGPTLVLAGPELLEDEQGVPFLSWELRGGRVCIRSSEEGGELPPGTRFTITEVAAGRYALREVDPPPGKSPCPLIEVRQARQGDAR